MYGAEKIWLRTALVSGLMVALATTGCDGDDDNGSGQTGGANATGGRPGTGGKSGSSGGTIAKGGQVATGGMNTAGATNNAGRGGVTVIAGNAGRDLGGSDAGGSAGTNVSGSSSTGGSGAAGQNTGGVAGNAAAGSSSLIGGAAGQSAATGGAATGGTVAVAGGGAGGIAGQGVAGFGTAGTDRNVFRPESVPFTAARLAELTAPAGFRVSVFAQNLGGPRMLAVHDGRVYVTRPDDDDVMMLADTNDDGVAETADQARADLESVHGIVFRGSTVYLATVTSVYRATVNADGTFGTPTEIINDLPPGGQHPKRTLGIGPDNRLYISIGSSCDACLETDSNYATIQRAELDGSNRTILASGLRNTLGFDWHPTTQQLWGMDQGSDWRGNALPPEELNRIAGGNYGWPYCYSQRVIDTITAEPPTGTKAAICSASVPPVLEYTAHGSPIQMTFYRGAMFPAEYVDDAFLALHGSWNRFPPSGYKIVRIRYDASGTPIGFEDFVTGFLTNGGAAQFGRPAGIAVADDGALLVSDDDNGVIYRVAYAP